MHARKSFVYKGFVERPAVSRLGHPGGRLWSTRNPS